MLLKIKNILIVQNAKLQWQLKLQSRLHGWDGLSHLHGDEAILEQQKPPTKGLRICYEGRDISVTR